MVLLKQSNCLTAMFSGHWHCQRFIRNTFMNNFGPGHLFYLFIQIWDISSWQCVWHVYWLSITQINLMILTYKGSLRFLNVAWLGPGPKMRRRGHCCWHLDRAIWNLMFLLYMNLEGINLLTRKLLCLLLDAHVNKMQDLALYWYIMN